MKILTRQESPAGARSQLVREAASGLLFHKNREARSIVYIKVQVAACRCAGESYASTRRERIIGFVNERNAYSDAQVGAIEVNRLAPTYPPYRSSRCRR